MLRISRSDEGSAAPTIKLEGKLLEPWVDEVRRLVVRDGGPFPRLDLAELRFVDAAGSRLLRELMARGVQVDACAPYVAELLHWARSNHQGISHAECDRPRSGE